MSIEHLLVASSVMYAIARVWDACAKFLYRKTDEARMNRMEQREAQLIEILDRLTPKG